jgi:rubrerythrin
MKDLSINEVIEIAVQIEKNGFKYYSEALKRKDISSQAKLLLEDLKKDEIKHEAIFKSFRSSEDYQQMGDPIDWQEAVHYLNSIVVSHVFHKPDAAIKLAASATDEAEIISFAIQFEKDTIVFFSSLAKEITDSKTKNTINAIIDEEISHVSRLVMIHQNLSK